MSQFPISPRLQQLYATLGTFIQLVSGLDDLHVVQGLPNRAAMPTPGFISYQALFRKRLRTNQHQLVEVGTPAIAMLDEGVELTVQIDCYGPQSNDPSAYGAEDWASILSATLRDEYGCAQLAPLLSPLYADEARMIPLVDGEEQYEERWSLDAHFQYDPVTTIPQQYAATLDLEMIRVPQESYPP